VSRSFIAVFCTLNLIVPRIILALGSSCVDASGLPKPDTKAQAKKLPVYLIQDVEYVRCRLSYTLRGPHRAKVESGKIERTCLGVEYGKERRLRLRRHPHISEV
jgi:hypothetical protein